MRGWRGYVGLILMVCLLAGLTACKSPGVPSPSGETPASAKPKVADKAETQEALTTLEEDLASILKTLDDLDFVDEEDLVP